MGKCLFPALRPWQLVLDAMHAFCDALILDSPTLRCENTWVHHKVPRTQRGVGVHGLGGSGVSHEALVSWIRPRDRRLASRSCEAASGVGRASSQEGQCAGKGRGEGGEGAGQCE